MENLKRCAGWGWKRRAAQMRRTERSDTPVAVVTRRVQCTALAWRLRECQLDHAVDQRAGGNGDRLGFLVLSQSRRCRLRAWTVIARVRQVSKPGRSVPDLLGQQNVYCNKFALMLLDRVLC